VVPRNAQQRGGNGSINWGEGERWRQLIWDMPAASCGDETRVTM